MSDDAGPIETFGRLEEVASFFLTEAFRYIDMAAHLTSAGLVFAEALENVEPEPGWIPPSSPSTVSEWLKGRKGEDTRQDATADRLYEAWKDALRQTYDTPRKIHARAKLETPDVLGHVINISACLECVVNRHLWTMHQGGTLNSHNYRALDRTEVIPKILFVFKEEINSKSLDTARLTHLLRLRNNAVHSKGETVGTVSVTVEELVGIWRDLSDLLALVDGEPSPGDLDELVRDFRGRWTV